MTGDDADTGAVAVPRRSDSWSFRKIVEDVSGKSIEEFQDPNRTPHPYLRVKPPAEPPRPRVTVRAPPSARNENAAPDPVARVFPPLIGETGRALHPPEHHHLIAPLPPSPEEVAATGRGAPSEDSPGRKPERVYLHYLLLHLDRLSDHALTYLKHAVDEERAHRSPPPSP
jgi:hypothetical protein